MSFRVTPTAVQAQRQGLLDKLGQGFDAATVRLYTTARPATPGDHSDTPQATIALADPPAVLSSSGLRLTTGAPGMVLTSGVPVWGEICAASGALLIDGTVSGVLGAGDIRVSYPGTADTEEAPTLYAGGTVTLADDGYLT